jgi:hypothetical protein
MEGLIKDVLYDAVARHQSTPQSPQVTNYCSILPVPNQSKSVRSGSGRYDTGLDTGIFDTVAFATTMADIGQKAANGTVPLSRW